MWFLVGLVGLLVGGLVVALAVGFVPHELDGVRASHRGIPGRVENVRCTELSECRADFVGDDGTRIVDVRLNSIAKQPRYVRARVSSAHATEAWPDSPFNGIGLVVLPLVLVVAGLGRAALRHRRGRHHKAPDAG
ncbi:hypothetical protein ABZS66_31500 [Dactylosporangium sp. NPDC005572]|uniref:hypothetical protein n=1 Tax=Dactylosporangium sp. NPDC005572 TaxID=3156889 RepID=UPI0033B2817F